MEKVVRISSIIFEDKEIFICLNEKTNIFEFFYKENEKFKKVPASIQQKLNAIYNKKDGKIKSNNSLKNNKTENANETFSTISAIIYDKNKQPKEVDIVLSDEMMDYSWHIKLFLKKFSEKLLIDNAFGDYFDASLFNNLTIKFDTTYCADYYDIENNYIAFKDDCFYEEGFYHELLHFLTHKKANLQNSLGFEKLTKTQNGYFNNYTGINEGATDYYAYGELESSYPELKFFYKIITKIVGEEQCKYYYAHSLPEQLFYHISKNTNISYREIVIIMSSLDVLNSSILEYRNNQLDMKSRNKLMEMFAINFHNISRLYFNYLLKNNPDLVKDLTFDKFLEENDRNYIKQNKNFYKEKLLKEQFVKLKALSEKKAEQVLKGKQQIF